MSENRQNLESRVDRLCDRIDSLEHTIMQLSVSRDREMSEMRELIGVVQTGKNGLALLFLLAKLILAVSVIAGGISALWYTVKTLAR